MKKIYLRGLFFAALAMFSTISNSQTVTLPYSEGFDSDDAESSFTIIDVNDDYTTWSISDGKAEYFNLFSDSQADDWLITPSFYLEAGKSYQFSFKANTYDLSETGTFEAKLGSENTAEAMTIEVLPETSVSTDQPTDFTKIISVETSGVYYFGIHCLNQPEMTTLDVDDILIQEAAVASAPGQVENATIAPDPLGALKAQITFNAPSTTVDGSQLSALDSVVVYRNSTQLAGKVENPVPGQQYAIDDDSPENGTNIYTFTAYIGGNAGNPVSVTSFIGEDVPNPVTDVKAHADGDDVEIAWTAPTAGWNGHYINPDSVWYTIYVSQGSALNRELVADSVFYPSYTITGIANTGSEVQNIYRVYAHTKGGSSSVSNSNTLLIGKPHDLPFVESVADGGTSYRWYADRSNGAEVISSTESADGDGHSLVFNGTSKGNFYSLQSGKINTSEQEHLKFTFYTRYAQDSKLTVGLMRDGDTLSVVDVPASDDWTEVNVPVDAAKDKNYVQVYFRVDFGGELSSVYIDNIQVTNDEPSGPTDGIIAVKSVNDNATLRYYDVTGREVQSSHRGLTIIRKQNGSVVKVLR